MLSALRCLVAVGRFSDQRALDDLLVLERADIRRHSHTPLLRIGWALRQQISACDAAYVAPAAALDCTLITTDRKLARVADLPCVIEVA